LELSEVTNTSAMSVRCLPATDACGAEVGLIIAKMAYVIDSAAKRSITWAPVRLHAESHAGGRSIRYPSDLAVEKPGTDVMLVGTAHPPAARQLNEMYVRLRVGPTISKTVRVIGPRTYQRQGLLGVAPGRPGPLEPTPLVYERAYGGTDDTDPEAPVSDPRNPVGAGFALERLRLVGASAPQLEDPNAPLTSDQPAPAGFGPIAPHWQPRARFAGTYDMRWARERAPIVPLDWHPRHNCAAPEDLWTSTPLRGDEPIEVIGATPEGQWKFQLPRYAPLFGVVILGARTALETHLDTVLIDADARRVELVWRAWFPMPKKLGMVDAVEVAGDGELPRDVLGLEGPPPAWRGDEEEP
jgi:hypothetical protein